MKVTKSQLKQIIKEELEAALDEYHSGQYSKAPRGPVFKRDTEEDDDPIEEDGIPFKKLKKGRCTPMGTEECPKGSPQYNLAKAFKGKIRQSNLKRGKNPHGPG